MELMDTSLDKFYKKVIEKGKTIPEDILGKITVAVREVLYILLTLHAFIVEFTPLGVGKPFRNTIIFKFSFQFLFS